MINVQVVGATYVQIAIELNTYVKCENSQANASSRPKSLVHLFPEPIFWGWFQVSKHTNTQLWDSEPVVACCEGLHLCLNPSV